MSAKKIYMFLLMCMIGFSLVGCVNVDGEKGNEPIESATNEISLETETKETEIDVKERLSATERVHGLSLIWKEAEYNFPFWSKLEGLDWDKAYAEALPRVMEAEDERVYYLELMKFITLLKDGHTDVSLPKELYDKYGRYPIWLDYVEGKHIIAFKDKNLGEDISLYDEVLSINGLPTKQYFDEKIAPYTWHEKFDSAYYSFQNLIPVVEEGRPLTIKTMKGEYDVQSTKETFQWTEKTTFKQKEQIAEIVNSDILQIYTTKENIAVIVIPTFGDDSLPSLFYENIIKVKDCSGFVIDVRDNGGGNSSNADAITQAFIKGSFKTGRDKKMIHIGTYKSWGQNMDFNRLDRSNPWMQKVYDISKRQYFEESVNMTENTKCPVTIDAPVVIIENAGTGSAAEDLLINFDGNNRGTIIGSPSFGSTGQPLQGDLPGGGSFRICTRWCTYPDGTEFINIGVQPDIFAELSVKDYVEGHDSVLEKALEEAMKQ